MKTATIPALRVEPEFRNAVESILRQGETLSNFMIESLEQNIYHRKTKQNFIAKGLLAEKEAKKNTLYFSNSEVMQELDEMLIKAKKK